RSRRTVNVGPEDPAIPHPNGRISLDPGGGRVVGLGRERHREKDDQEGQAGGHGGGLARGDGEERGCPGAPSPHNRICYVTRSAAAIFRWELTSPRLRSLLAVVFALTGLGSSTAGD